MSTTRSPRHPERTGPGLVAGGTVVFAASMLAVTGTWQVLAGVTALLDDQIYLVGLEYAYAFDLTTWGWVHLVVGALSLATAVGIFTGRSWALVVGIGIAAVSAVGNFAFLPYFPLWAVTVIAFDALVMWALSQQLTRAG